MSITAASASEQAQLDEAAALARATVAAAERNAKEKARVGDAARQAAIERVLPPASARSE